MEKVKNSIIAIILSLVLMFGVTLVTGCGEDGVSDSISLSQNEITIVLNGEDEAKEITVTKSSSNFFLFYKISNMEIISIELKEDLPFTSTYIIKPLSEGDCTITFASKENASVQSKLVVHVEKRLKEISFEDSGDIYIAQGSSYKISSRDVTLNPNVNLFEQTIITLDENGYGLTLKEDGTIDASSVRTNCRVKLTFTSKYNSEIKAEKYVSVISPLSNKTGIEIKDAQSSVYYALGEQVREIELVKSSDELSYKILTISVAGNAPSDLTYSSKVDGISVQTAISGGELTLQSVNVGESVIHIYIVQTRAINYFEPVEVVLKVNVIELPSMILLNGAKITNEAQYVYDYYDEGFTGLPFSLQAYPSANGDNNDPIELTFSNADNFVLMRKYASSTSGEEIDISSGSVIVSGNDELYLKAKNIESLAETKFSVIAKSLVAESYGIEVQAEIPLELKKGVQSISVEEQVRLKVGQSTEILTIGVTPENADASVIALRTSSSAISAVKLSSNTYRIIANSVTNEVQHVYFIKPNGAEEVCDVIIFEELSSLNVDVDDILSGRVSDKTYVSGKLDNVIVKCGERINLYIDINAGATITDLKVETRGANGIVVALNKTYFLCDLPGTYTIEVTAYGYNSDGEEHFIRTSFSVTSYKAISKFTINKNSAICYTAYSVGYYKEQELSNVSISATAYPIDAKYARDITWTVTDEMGAPIGTIGTLTTNGNYASFRASDIDTESSYIIVKATINQYLDVFTVSCRIQVLKAVKVDKVIATNISNQSLYFDSRKGLNRVGTLNPVNKYQIKTAIYPTNALNKNIRYEYRDEFGNMSSDQVCGILDDGTVIPYKAGRCKIYVCAEDSYISSTNPQVFTIINVTVQDGRSLETAFQITTPEELIAIGESYATMSYYYVVAQNINMADVDFTPFSLPFTGYLTGKISYIIGNDPDPSKNIEHVEYYSIYNLNLEFNASSNDEENVYLGLFSRVAVNTLNVYEGMPACGTIQNLTIGYNKFNIILDGRSDNATNYYVGGVVGFANLASNLKIIHNVKVAYNSYNVTLGMCNTYIGGLVGYAQKASLSADNECGGALVYGATMKIEQRTSANAMYYIGGICGQAVYTIISSRYQGIKNSVTTGESNAKYSSSFASENIDVTIAMLENNKVTSTNAFIGGIFGQTQGICAIDNVAVENHIYGYNNVGGLVGASMGTLTINKCFANCKISANSYIGGFVGNITSGSCSIENSYIQNYDDGEASDFELTQLQGANYIGGFVGYTQGNLTMLYSYSSSYITRAYNDDGTGFRGDIATSVEDASIGGLVGAYSSSGSVSIDKCYTNYLLYSSYTSGGSTFITREYAFIKQNGANVTNSYIVNTNYALAGGSSYIYDTYDNSFYAYFSEGKVNFVFAVGSYVADSEGEILEATLRTYLDVDSNVDAVYHIENGAIPYIMYGLDNNSLVELAPISISAKSIEDARNQIIVTPNGEKVLVLEYYKALDANKQLAIKNYNKESISNLIEMVANPNDGYVKRYVVTSSNNQILQITDDGYFVINSMNNNQMAQVEVTIKSKLNYAKQDNLYIVIIYATSGFGLYDNSAYQTYKMQEMALYKSSNLSQGTQIYPTITPFVIDDGASGIEVSSDNNIYIEYTFNREDYATYVNLANNRLYNEVHTITGIKETRLISPHKLMFNTKPYIIANINGVDCKLYLSDVFNSANAYQTPQVTVNVTLGATSISIIASDNLTAQSGDTITTTLRVYTSDTQEKLNFSVYNAQNELVATNLYDNEANAYKFNSEKVFALTDEILRSKEHYDANDNLEFIDYTISLCLKGKAREIDSTAVYTVRTIPASNQNLMALYNISYYPATVDRIESSYYTYGLKTVDGDKSYLNANEGARDMILPGTNGLLMIDVAPYFANYDYIEVTSQDKLNFTQNLYNPTLVSDIAGKKAYPYQEFNQISYLSTGIRLANVYYEVIEGNNVKLSYGKTGRYYVTVNAPVDTLIKTYTIKLTAYKVINGSATVVATANRVINCENLPVVKLAYRGEASSDVQDIYIPRGITDKLDVQIFNAVEDPQIFISTVKEPTVAYNFATVYKQDNSYYVSINKNASIGDNVLITFTCTKQVGEEIKVTNSTIQLIVVPYIIQDIGFNLVTGNVMREQFGGNFKLALSVENSKIFYDETDAEIYALIQSDFARISGYDYNTWYAYRSTPTSQDSSVGSYYSNEYITIKTLSSISKDLYVTGNFYDEIDSYLKYVGVHLKYYFDKSSNSYVFSKLVKSTGNRIASSPYDFSSSKTMQNGRYFIEQSKFFNVSFYMNTSLDNAKPIYNIQEFQNMEAGMSYVLMRNLELNEFVPITAQIAYLNGNNKTITVTSFKTTESNNIGIFASTSADCIIENLNVVITQRKLYVDAQNKSSVVYGTIVANNFGTLYNCSITYSGEGREDNTIVTTDTASGTVTGTQDYITSDSIIPRDAFGIAVQITVSDSENSSSVTSTMGALCGVNSGYITNCRVNSGLDLNGYGIIGGFVGQNNGTISSCYSKARVNSYTTVQLSSSVGGFAGRNGGKITLSYVEHLKSASSTAGVFSGTYVGINASTTASGFVHTNSGEVTNCYANLKVSTSASSAGFVLDNISGSIDNCYSACAVREHSKRDMAFVGVDSYNQVNNRDGGITNCYFMDGNFANKENQSAEPVIASEFNKTATFTTFAFSTNFDTSTGLTTAGVWMMPKQSAGQGDYVGQNFISGMPTLTSANLVSKGYVDLLSSSKTSDGNPEYKYSALIGATLGSASHPYVIYSTALLNRYIKEGSTFEGANSKYYVLAKNISFRDETKMAQTYFTDFSGVLNGNGMRMDSLRISYVDVDAENLDMENFGLFKKLSNGAIIQNLDIEVLELYGSAIQNVGVLAGTISRAYIYNINLTGSAVVQGKNIVGALAGVAHSDDSEIKNITSSLSVNATYKQNQKVQVGDKEAEYGTYSYAGGIFGILSGKTSASTKEIANIKVSDGAVIIGDVVGGAFGYVGLNREVKNIQIVVDDSMYLSGTTAIGGVAGISEGVINSASVKYEDEIQSALDNIDSVLNNGSQEGVGRAQDVANNNFFRYYAFGTHSQYGVIGGLVGIMVKGKVIDSYNKVNVINRSARILAGLVGNTIGGEISFSYARCVVDGGNRLDSSDVRIIGGIVGLNGKEINNTLKYSGISSSPEVLTLNNVVSIATFNKASFETYKYTTKDGNGNDVTYYPLIMGGVVGACDVEKTSENSESTISLNKVFYNAYAYNKNHAGFSVTNNDIRLALVGAYKASGEGAENFVTYSFQIAGIDVIYKEALGNASYDYGEGGYLYIQLVSDGIKKEDGDYYTYIPFDGASGSVVGKKTEAFAQFIIDDNFTFEDEDDATPVVKQVMRDTSLMDLFTIEGNNIYIKGADLYKASLITASNKTQWKKLNAFANYTLILSSDVSLNADWQGLKYFRGTLDGNMKTISFKHTQNNVPLIENANNAIIKNVAITDFKLNVSSGSANYGLIQVATNISLDTMSCTGVTVSGTMDSNNVGVLVGNLKGRYNSIARSYVTFNSTVPTTLSTMGAFVGLCSGSVQIQTCYSQNSKNGTQAISLIGTLASGQIAEILNTVLQNNNDSLPAFVNVNSGTIKTQDGGSTISYIIKEIPAPIDENKTFFTENDHWYYNGPVSPYNHNIWDNTKGDFPVHNFDPQDVLVLDGLGTYNDATRTYTLQNSLNLLNLANAVNNGSLANGGDGYTFTLAHDVDGLRYAVISGERYYIYTDYIEDIDYIIYSDGLRYNYVNDQRFEIDSSHYVECTIETEVIPAIGTEINPFRGTFDGAMHTISNIEFNGFISDTHIGYAGMFGKTQGATIKNVILKGVKVSLSGTGATTVFAGGVVGFAYATEINCVAFGDVNGFTTYNGTIGAGTPDEVMYDGTSTPVTSADVMRALKEVDKDNFVGTAEPYITTLNDITTSTIEVTILDATGNIYIGDIAGFGQTITIKNVIIACTRAGVNTSYTGYVIGYLIRHNAYISNILSYSDNSGSNYNGYIVERNNDVYQIDL